MFNVAIKDFFQLGSLRFLARIIKGLRGLFIIISLSPYDLGEYTIYLLYIFYFSCLEFGISHGLERDLPHYQGQKEDQTYQKVASIGWSSFFSLSFIVSLGLAVVCFFVFKEWTLALLLAGYLFADKIYRAYETNARIFFQYRTSGIAELIQVVTGFILIYYCLPRYGVYSIFPCFIAGSAIGTIYLALLCPLNFKWDLQMGQAFKYVKKTLPLTVMFYSIAIFHYIPMTIVALAWDKTVLGYYAFAFRIFQICLAIFPFLIREVMRTRMYFHLAKRGGNSAGFQDLMFPMSVYGIIVSVFWVAVYWWGKFTIARFVPEYKASISAMSILLFSLLPLGISKISSDFLCSRIFNKTAIVNWYWILGIIFQIVCIFFAGRHFQDTFNLVPSIYVVGTFLVYIFVVGYAFRMNKELQGSLFLMVFLLMPLIIAVLSIVAIRFIFNGMPSLIISKNIWFSMGSIISTLIVSSWLVWLRNKSLNLGKDVI